VEQAAQPGEGPAPADFQPAVPPPEDPGAEVQVPVETLGVVTVNSDDGRLLAALLERFGASRSFVRDSSWTLVVPPGGGG